MAKNIEIKYYVTYIRADQYVDILPLNEEGFEDIAEIDYLTLDYTKENFQKKIALQYPNIENPQVFITRVKKNKETNESELKNYTILYNPEKILQAPENGFVAAPSHPNIGHLLLPE